LIFPREKQVKHAPGVLGIEHPFAVAGGKRFLNSNQKCLNLSAMKITDILLAEHMVFHNVFDHIESRLPGLKTLTEVKALAELMENLLRAHGQAEEELVFAPLEHCLEQIGQRDTFENEHHEIDESLLKVKSARQLAVARRLLSASVLASRKHFDHEERIVFPMAERVLKAKTLSELGTEWLRKRQTALK
jgi:hemerythrin-like domain-containing protein